MSEEAPLTVAPESAETGWGGLPSWSRMLIIAGAVIVVAILALFAWRLASRVPNIPLGETPAAELQPGACLEESDLELDTYTVVPCTEPHPMQVFAVASTELSESVYAQAGDALRMFADEVCMRYVEYRLYLDEELDRDDYLASAIDVPTADEYAAGEFDVRCAVRAESGDDLTEDLYRPLP